MTTDTKKFSKQDAVDLLLTARSAPLRNMDHAQAIQGLLDRFTEFYESTIDETPGSAD